MMDTKNFDPDAFKGSAGEAADLMRALSNERRLMLLCQLQGKEMTVGEIHSKLDLSQSALSQHLATLRDQKIVGTRRDGQNIYYRIINPAALQIISTLASIFCPMET
jgi:DNA-binding transcriptional ArsR family regulator